MAAARRTPGVVITGMGAVTPLGGDLPTTWRNLMAGAGGVHRARSFDPTGLPVTFGGEIAPPPGNADLKAWLTTGAAAQALAAAGHPDMSRSGIFVGSEPARLPLHELCGHLHHETRPDPRWLEGHAPWAPAAMLAALCSSEGPQATVSTACTSSAQALGEALLALRRGDLELALAGGVDVLVEPLMLAGFALLGALSQRNDEPERASRPFDVHRDGFVLADGAGFLVLETVDHAVRRGATPLAELAGYGCSLNAWRITDSPPDGGGAALAMSLAMEDAGVDSRDVGYVNAHGTSTVQNDASETQAILRALGHHGEHVPVSSTKGATGHMVAACGAVEAIFTAMALLEGRLPATRNLDSPDPICPLNHVRGAPLEARVDVALTNSFGFGGSNATLALRRCR